MSLALLLTAVISANAQILRAEELEKYAKEKYGDKWVEAASNLGKQLTLDKNNAIDYVQVMEAPSQSKAQLYVLLNYWFTATFNEFVEEYDLIFRLFDGEVVVFDARQLGGQLV